MGPALVRRHHRRRREFALGDGEAHLWFPRYELVTHLVLKSEIRKSTIKFYQCFLGRPHLSCGTVPEDDMFVVRALPHDRRAPGQPVSLVADFVK